MHRVCTIVYGIAVLLLVSTEPSLSDVQAPPISLEIYNSGKKADIPSKLQAGTPLFLAQTYQPSSNGAWRTLGGYWDYSDNAIFGEGVSGFNKAYNVRGNFSDFQYEVRLRKMTVQSGSLFAMMTGATKAISSWSGRMETTNFHV